MTIVMVLMIIGFILALAWSVVDWVGILRKYFANKPEKGRVYVQISKQEAIPVNAKRTGVSKKGQVFQYKWEGKERIVLIPNDYPIQYVQGRRVIAVHNGRLVASRLFGEKSRELDTDAISSIILSTLIVDLINSLTSRGMSKWIWIILLVAGAAVMVFLFRQMGGGISDNITPPPLNPETGEEFIRLLTVWGA